MTFPMSQKKFTLPTYLSHEICTYYGLTKVDTKYEKPPKICFLHSALIKIRIATTMKLGNLGNKTFGRKLLFL